MEIRKILVGIDFSEQSEHAAREAAAIAKRTNATMTLVHIGSVVRDIGWVAPSSVKEWERVLRAQAEEADKKMVELCDRLSDGGVEVSRLVRDEAPAEGVCAAAEQVGADLVVVGSHGRTGLKRFFLGSVAERVARLCNGDVLVARGAATEAYRRLLVPTDFSPHAEMALRRAISVAEPGATIDLVHFWLLPVVVGGGFGEAALVSSHGEHRSAVDALGERLVEKYKSDKIELSFQSIERSPAEGIVHHASAEGAEYDAIVLGSHGRRGLRRFLLGSVAERVVRRAPCSVMVVHVPED